MRQCAATLTTGNPSLFTGRNIVTGYRDDADNHLLKARTEADGLLRGTTDGYDACTDARPCVSATDEYNAFGQKERETVTYPPALSGAEGFSKRFSYTYDNSGQKRSFMMPDGTTYSYTNDNNELRNIRIPGVSSRAPGGRYEQK
ncbi:MAG: hypothetical protein GY801_24150 [bacterium]|nr:hypothetical protein [bacterium]